MAMKQVTVQAFGGPEQLAVETLPTPMPGSGQVLVRVTSIGLNHADLMARRGEYRLISGDPPFVPGLEAGGVIEAVGRDVEDRTVGQRVLLSPTFGRRPEQRGTYRTHLVVDAGQTLAAPAGLPDEQLGAVWLAYLTAWGCLVWQQGIEQGQIIGLPAASSSVALAAAQIAKQCGAVTIGLTRTEEKAQRIGALPHHGYDHFLVTHETDGAIRKWHRQIAQITEGKGVNCYFDPVAAGAYLDSEIKSLADGGTIWVYGLLANVGPVDVTPLIRKRGAIRGWIVGQVLDAGDAVWREGCEHILQKIEDGRYRQHIDRIFSLDQVQQAHAYMERGEHVGKLVLVP